MRQAKNRLPVRAIVLSIAAGVVFFFLFVTQVAAQPEPVETVRYLVERGDTLWELAAERTEPGNDVRDKVVTIKRLNGLESSELRTGQVLLLPE